jgi:hypothetical protein
MNFVFKTVRLQSLYVRLRTWVPRAKIEKSVPKSNRSESFETLFLLFVVRSVAILCDQSIKTHQSIFVLRARLVEEYVGGCDGTRVALSVGKYL